jgi:hypothetical protein
LDISHTNIPDIPDIPNSLTDLDISYTNITDIPENLINKKSLTIKSKHIDIEKNQFRPFSGTGFRLGNNNDSYKSNHFEQYNKYSNYKTGLTSYHNPNSDPFNMSVLHKKHYIL